MLKGYTEDTLCLPTDDKEAQHFLQSISTLMKKHGEKLTHLDKIPSPEGGTTTGKISDIEHCYTVLIHPLKDFIRQREGDIKGSQDLAKLTHSITLFIQFSYYVMTMGPLDRTWYGKSIGLALQNISNCVEQNLTSLQHSSTCIDELCHIYGNFLNAVSNSKPGALEKLIKTITGIDMPQQRSRAGETAAIFMANNMIKDTLPNLEPSPV